SRLNSRKPGESLTASARAANRFSSSGPAPSGTSIALIFTTAMTPAYLRQDGPGGERGGGLLRRAGRPGGTGAVAAAGPGRGRRWATGVAAACDVRRRQDHPEADPGRPQKRTR